VATLLALLLVFVMVTFAGAMVFYVAVLARKKQPVSFFDLPRLGKEGNSLTQWAYWLWIAAIGAVVLFGVLQVKRFLLR
jgi:hypothetical protein